MKRILFYLSQLVLDLLLDSGKLVVKFVEIFSTLLPYMAWLAGFWLAGIACQAEAIWPRRLGYLLLLALILLTYVIIPAVVRHIKQLLYLRKKDKGELYIKPLLKSSKKGSVNPPYDPG